MARPLVSDDLWAAIEPLLPPRLPEPKGGRPPIPDRAALAGIVFVLKSGIPWEMLLAEMGCGSGMSCWRRLRDWHGAWVWAALHRALLERLQGAGGIDWRRAALDSASVPAKRGARRSARTRPTAVSPARSGTWSRTPAAPHSASP
jgi:transposase